MEGKTEGLGKKTKGDWKEDREGRRRLEQRRSVPQRIQPLYGHALVVEEFDAHELKWRFSIDFPGSREVRSFIPVSRHPPRLFPTITTAHEEA